MSRAVKTARIMTTISKKNVANVIKSINAEGVSLGAIIRNFVAVANTDNYASYMLDTIVGAADAKITHTVNDIRKAVISWYPYKKDGKLLAKKDGLYIPMDKYSGDIIRKAFYHAVGATDEETIKDFVPATEQQIAEAEAKAEAKKAEKAKEKEDKKKNQDLMAQLWQEVMTAKDAEHGWEIINKYREAAKDLAK